MADLQPTVAAWSRTMKRPLLRFYGKRAAVVGRLSHEEPIQSDNSSAEEVDMEGGEEDVETWAEDKKEESDRRSGRWTKRPLGLLLNMPTHRMWRILHSADTPSSLARSTGMVDPLDRTESWRTPTAPVENSSGGVSRRPLMDQRSGDVEGSRNRKWKISRMLPEMIPMSSGKRSALQSSIKVHIQYSVHFLRSSNP
jgi:hypothetical protein